MSPHSSFARSRITLTFVKRPCWSTDPPDIEEIRVEPELSEVGTTKAATLGADENRSVRARLREPSEVGFEVRDDHLGDRHDATARLRLHPTRLQLPSIELRPRLTPEPNPNTGTTDTPPLPTPHNTLRRTRRSSASTLALLQSWRALNSTRLRAKAVRRAPQRVRYQRRRRRNSWEPHLMARAY